MPMKHNKSADPSGLITLFLCGDVMTGRGIDQILPHPGDPFIPEFFIESAKGYVELAETANGPIPYPVDFSYIWGDALTEWGRMQPDLKIINLETSITKNSYYFPGKGVNYRMNPENIPCLSVAGIDCCSLANNHVLDWDYAGLKETCSNLQKAHIKSAGAGQNLQKAASPAIMTVSGKGRVLVYGCGSISSGIHKEWAAAAHRPGVWLLEDLSEQTAGQIGQKVLALKQPRDLVVVSIHWGGNWGYTIGRDQQEFAHRLIEAAGVDVIHGHSSHHVKGIEVYRGKLILYGCGDFIDDYEGISGFKDFRADLGLMYFAALDPVSGNLTALYLTPTKIKNFKINRASQAEAQWLREVLNREGQKLGTGVALNPDKTLTLRWD
jgi:poly-gamma-glutamate capsule biosynthesis protein CapA/YwtB (metallophosphatase superfamily)